MYIVSLLSLITAVTYNLMYIYTGNVVCVILGRDQQRFPTNLPLALMIWAIYLRYL